MAQIAITGAAGRIGSEAINELSDHQLTPIDIESPSETDVDFLNLDITKGLDRLVDAFEGHDVVIHLAAHANPYEEWENILELNIGGTYNVFEAASRAEVERVVFASSNHVMHMHNIDDPSAPETMTDDANAISPMDVPAPDSYYGTSKLLGEGLSTVYAEQQGMEFVNLRIGWYLTPSELEEYQDEAPNVARYARAMYLSSADCRHILRRSVEAELPRNPLSVHVTSRNQDRYLSLTDTMRALDYRPQDDSAEVLDLN